MTLTFLHALFSSPVSNLLYFQSPFPYLTCPTNSSYNPASSLPTKLTAISTTTFARKVGKPLNTPPGRSLPSTSSRHSTSCATIHKIFKCTPYANKKSHKSKTSGNGGVHAHRVSTEGKA